MKLVAIALGALFASTAFAADTGREAQKMDHKAKSSISQNADKSGVIKLNETQIREIQTALVGQGAALVVNGKMGKDTTQALMSFQKENQLPVTGKPTAETLAKLGVSL